ncbi:MAG TPA: hypothetical protein VN699_05800 [Pirellulales bacterium]|nr:hypothetical protein [Pirellulales bacterium]
MLLFLSVLAWSSADGASARAAEPDGEFEGEHSYKLPDGKEVQLKELSSKARNQARNKINDVLKPGKAATAEDEKAFADYFRLLIAELTWKENIPSLPEKRKSLKTKELAKAGAAAAPDLHLRLNKLILGEMQKVAKDNRYPRAVRLNCVLMIGELDQSEPHGLAAGTPLPDAAPVLMDIFADESLHYALRIDALVCLKRHVNANLSAERRRALVDALASLLKTKDAPKGKSPLGHMWLRMVACEVIETMAEQGDDASQPEVIAAMESFVGEKDTDLWLRCRAGEVFGSLSSKALQNSAAGVARKLGDLVVEVSKTHPRLLEAAGVEASKKKKPGKPEIVKKPDDEAAEPESPPIPERVLDVATEDVVDQLLRIRFALTGAAVNAKEVPTDRGIIAATPAASNSAAADAKTAPFATELLKSIDGMLKTLKDTKREKVELLAEVATDGEKLEGLLKAQAAPAATTESAPVKTAKEKIPGVAKPPAGNSGAAESAVGP